MTKRQWVIIQVALLALKENILYWNDDEDGPPPTQEEFDELIVELDPGWRRRPGSF